MSENTNAIETPQEDTLVSQTVLGIRFRSCGKIYTFKIDNIEVALGDRVIVESEMGLSLGFVAKIPYAVEKPEGKFKRVLRKANEKDLETLEENKKLEEEAKAFCIQKAREYKLEMKLVTTETTLDRKRLVFYFTADGRIDFRELVRELASKFKTRIEMRQIGVRDEVKLIGGLGACGRQACCNLFLTSFAPITIRMAKEQDLSINQSKLSGICGRLMCCLGYEHYERPKKRGDRPARKKQAPAAKEEAPQKAAPEEEKPEQETLKTARPEVKSEVPRDRVGESEAVTEEKTEDEKKNKRSRRRRRRFRPRKKGGEKTEQQDKKEASGAPKETEKSKSGEQQPAQKKKSKSFRKRKRFMKKKKPTENAE